MKSAIWGTDKRSTGASVVSSFFSFFAYRETNVYCFHMMAGWLVVLDLTAL